MCIFPLQSYLSVSFSEDWTSWFLKNLHEGPQIRLEIDWFGQTQIKYLSLGMCKAVYLPVTFDSSVNYTQGEMDMKTNHLTVFPASRY